MLQCVRPVRLLDHRDNATSYDNPNNGNSALAEYKSGGAPAATNGKHMPHASTQAQQ